MVATVAFSRSPAPRRKTLAQLDLQFVQLFGKWPCPNRLAPPAQHLTHHGLVSLNDRAALPQTACCVGRTELLETRRELNTQLLRHREPRPTDKDIDSQTANATPLPEPETRGIDPTGVHTALSADAAGATLPDDASHNPVWRAFG
jgi:hypothetical protein